VSIDTIIVFSLAALFAGFLFVLWYVAASRRRALREAEATAALAREKTGAWKRLNRSAAGAP
jgi:arginine exporter protein ArgO